MKQKPPVGRGGWRCLSFVGLLSAISLLMSQAADAGSLSIPMLPDAVTIPSGLNLGNTSFYDGAGDAYPAFAIINYDHYSGLNSITDADGRNNPAFNKPRIDSFADVVQLIWVATEGRYGGYGLTILQPFIDFNSHFDTPGAVLTNNGVSNGDTTVGPFFQSKPVSLDGHPFLFYRLEVDTIAPSGGFNKSRDINQGSGFWSLNPEVAFTILPTSKLEISGRLNYLYNFQTSHAANVEPIPGFLFRSGQAGQAAWLNFSSSYKITPKFELGVNGYYLKQLTNDKVNGASLNGTERSAVYVGPGLHYAFSPNDGLNINGYLPVETRGLATGAQVNVEFLHVF